MSRIFSASFRLDVSRLKRVRASARLVRAASTAELKAPCSDDRHRQRAGLCNAHRFGVHPTASFLCRGVRTKAALVQRSTEKPMFTLACTTPKTQGLLCRRLRKMTSFSVHDCTDVRSRLHNWFGDRLTRSFLLSWPSVAGMAFNLTGPPRPQHGRIDGGPAYDRLCRQRRHHRRHSLRAIP